ncbi:hypothetical protein [Anaerosolibacter sp.]|uniref:hypothetical protein n=1 Tax=Anaerosolibacter sp. TaxID=1872527 RepID=UPI0039EF3EE2
MLGLSRLYAYLSNVHSYPIPLKAAATISGMREYDVAFVINRTRELTGLRVEDGKIHYTEGKFSQRGEGVYHEVC